MANQLTREQRLERALRDLIRHYVIALENGRDRIIELGGECDPVEAMERSDPYLRKAREALAYGVSEARHQTFSRKCPMDESNSND
jgi:hypothetical protein